MTNPCLQKCILEHKLLATMFCAVFSEELICTHAQSHRRCFDMYVIHFEQEIGNEGSEPYMIKSDWIIPSLSDSGDETLTLNVTTNTTLSTNMFYRATLITTMDMIEAGSILSVSVFCCMNSVLQIQEHQLN